MTSALTMHANVATIQPVAQEDITGCGIACVASLAGVRYREVKARASRLGVEVTDSRLWSDPTVVRTLLKQYGIRATPKELPFRSWEALPPLALLAIKWHRKGNQASWHWIIFWQSPTGPVVLDPKKTLKHPIRTDWGRMKPKWFIAITLQRSGQRERSRQERNGP